MWAVPRVLRLARWIAGWALGVAARADLAEEAVRLAAGVQRGRRRGQSVLSGGPRSDMSCFSKIAATAALSGVLFRVAGPSSS